MYEWIDGMDGWMGRNVDTILIYSVKKVVWVFITDVISNTI